VITLKNWNKQQPEVVYFVQINWQDDEETLCKLVRSEISKEQWNKTVAKYSDREIYRVDTENVGGELHSWVYFKDSD
jgi:hypothetical protein